MRNNPLSIRLDGIKRAVCAIGLVSLPLAAQQLQNQIVIVDSGPAPQQGVAARPMMTVIGAGTPFEGNLVKGAPYSADAVTETVQRLADGNKITNKSTSSIYRDSEGRTRREIALNSIGPWPAKGAGKQIIWINDPVARVSYQLDPETKTARKMPMGLVIPGPGAPGPGGELPPLPRLRMPHPGVPTTITAHRMSPAHPKTENLGKRNIEGVIAEGIRSTVTIPAGEIGNEQPIEIVSERWFSDELKTAVLTKVNDPRFGETTYRLTNIRHGEPPRDLFDVPADYKVEEPSEPGARLEYKIND
jgi:hypothetical protein